MVRARFNLNGFMKEWNERRWRNVEVFVMESLKME